MSRVAFARIAGALAGVALLGAAQAQDAPQEPFEPAPLTVDDARSALDHALAWLVASQREDGAWGSAVCDSFQFGDVFSVETYYAWQVAASGLACLALLTADETPERRAALDRGLAWLCEGRAPKRGSDWDVDYVWSGLYGTVALVEAADDPRFAGDEDQARLAAGAARYLDILVRNQAPAGGWGYYDDPIYSRRPQWATSFCTALVLPALKRSLERGWLDDPAVLARAQRYVARCAVPEGAYEYSLNPVARINGGEHINRVRGSLGRTQVCNWGLREVGEKKITPERVREGLDAFFEHHAYLDVARLRPIPHEAYYQNAGYFYLFGHAYAAYAINALPADEREPWHAKLRAHLVKVQHADGSAFDFHDMATMTAAGTAYLALALALGMPEA